MLKIKITEYGKDWWLVQETNGEKVINYQLGMSEERQYTAKQLMSLLQTLESEAEPYIKTFNKTNWNK